MDADEPCTVACRFKFERRLTDTEGLSRLALHPTHMAGSAQLADTHAQEVRRKGLKRFMFSLPSYVCSLGIVVVGMLLGDVDRASGMALCVVSASLLLVFYVVLRTGLAVRSSDPLLAFSQVLLALSLVAFGYVMLGGLHNAALLWLCVIIAFDMRRLPTLHVWMAAAFCLLTMLVAMGVRVAWHVGGEHVMDEVPTLIMLFTVLPVMLFVSSQARQVIFRQARQKTQMAQTLAQLHQLSTRDGLTGLYCRRHMQEVMAQEMRRWQRSGQPFCVAVIDIDLFKRVNDQFGHATGDVVLRVFSDLGRSVFPDLTDALGRWGGEEFLLLQPQRTQSEAMAALNLMRDVVNGHDWSQYAAGLHVTFSAGLCAYREGATLDQVIGWADDAMYRAKSVGRDQIVTHDSQQATEKAATTVARCCASGSGDAEPIQPDAFERAQAPQARAPSAQTQSGWAHWLWGRNPKLRIHLSMCLLAAGVYVAGMAGVLFYSLPERQVTPHQAFFMLTHYALGAFVPAALVRMGLTAHLRDPSCVLLQLTWAGLGAGLSYGVMPLSGPTTLQILCLCVVFGFASLQAKEARFIGLTYIGILVAVAGVRAWTQPLGYSPHTEILTVAMACLVLWMLTLISQDYSHTRQRIRHERQALLTATEQLNQVMQHDPLTGLLNRQSMQGILERECARQTRSDQGYCVALIDLDHFKRINDEHGHHVGDEALVGFAKAAQAWLRETDVICRWGGEEFLVLLTHTEPGPNGLVALERLCEHVASRRFCADVPALQVTFSAGLALLQPGASLSAALVCADRALYKAKAAGRNRCVLCAG